MKVLLDTNILIHRETHRVREEGIGQIFGWLDRLHYTKYVHPISVEEISKHQDPEVVQSFKIKLDSYRQINRPAPLAHEILNLINRVDNTENSKNDSRILNEVFIGRIDLLISEDNGIHRKARALGIPEKVLKISEFLEQAISAHPDLTDYTVLAVRKLFFDDVDVNDTFFDSFRNDYGGEAFNRWFTSKIDTPCYVYYNSDQVGAFLYIKVEDEKENYSDLQPQFQPLKRIKIGTMKVISNGFKIGERLLKIVFDNAVIQGVKEIYVTIFEKRQEQEDLIELLEKWGFEKWGIKNSANGQESVFIRRFDKRIVHIADPRKSYPFFSWESKKYLIPIEPQYHDELFPDSLLSTTDVNNYTENEPHRNRIEKVYISHAPLRDIDVGSVLVMYRMGEKTPKRFHSTVTCLCIVQEVHNNIVSFEEFTSICRRRTVISESDLRSKWWEKFGQLKPFVIRLLHAWTFPRPKPTLNDLVNLGLIQDIRNMPRGISEIDPQSFKRLADFAFKKR